MKSTHLKTLRKILPPAILFISLMSIYLRTLAPGLTWAHDGSDGGDLISAAVTGGIAHPTGYPLYLLLARTFQYLPIGSLAFRTNLFSALATSFAAVLVYGLVLNASENTMEDRGWLHALTASCAFGLAPLIWSQAVITEVYGLQILLLALILVMYTREDPFSISSKIHLDCWRGLILGLAMGNHLSTILVVPVALTLGSMEYRTQRPGGSHSQSISFVNVTWNRNSFLRQLGMFSVGLSVYLIIPLRAMTNLPINWGNAVSPDRFWWLVSGQLYRSYYLQSNVTEVWNRIQSTAAILVQQFGYLGVVLGSLGLVVFGKPSKLFLLTTWTAVVSLALAVVYGSADSYVYLMPVLLSFAIWIGIGISGLSSQFVRWSSLLRISLPLLLIGFLAARSVIRVDQVDASTDTRAESFAVEILSAAPADAILFARGDEAIFALWYFHFALGERPDLCVLAEDLLHFDWYQENLRSTYPSLTVPGPFPWPEDFVTANPTRAICYVRYTDHAELTCSNPAGSYEE